MNHYIEEPTEREISADAAKVIAPMSLMNDCIEDDVFFSYLIGVICALCLGYVLCIIVPPSIVFQWVTTIVQAIPALPVLPTF